MPNTLYYGDNLKVLREEIPSNSVDLIYLDPPFNSQASYNLLFRSPVGAPSSAQIEAFDDTWHWGEEAEQAFDDVLTGENTGAAQMLHAMRSLLGDNDVMAYLAMMAVRLSELHRVLRPTGSMYLHCDPTAGHYLKLLLDATFGARLFRNEITWKRTAVHGDSKTWSRVSDYILFYTKSDRFTWSVPREALSQKYIASHYSSVDADGRRYQLTSILSPSPRPRMMYEWRGFPSPPMGWRFSKERMGELDQAGLIWYPRRPDGSLDHSKRPRFKRYLDLQLGGVITTVWTDIPPVNSQAQERLGYPTQKPVALLERIIAASSNPGDVVLDPFCGCGTAIHAAQKLGRAWLGIDVTHLAISLIEKRLNDAFPGLRYEVRGAPEDLEGARDLARRDKYQFQWWAVSLVDAQPYGGKKKGADRGIDGVIYFRTGRTQTERAVVSVKGGENVGINMVRELRATMERERAPAGLLILLNEPTRPMESEAAAAGLFVAGESRFPRLQIVTVRELFQGKRPKLPPLDRQATFRKAPRERRETAQEELAI